MRQPLLSIGDPMQQELYYKEAVKLGQKEVRARLAKNEEPYLPALDDIIPPEKALTGVPLGVIQIPVWFIVGTKTSGRLNAFAANFLPIIDEGTEFADKWETPPLPIFLRKRLYKKRFLIFTTAYLYLKRRSFSNINEKHNLMI